MGAKLPPTGDAPVQITNICCDSREARPGALFVAVPGTHADGAGFAADAIRRGAAAVVADRPLALPVGVPIIRVANARAAVSPLAATFFGLDRIQAGGEMATVGITGTNGKSTVAYMLRAILCRADRRAALLGTIEYDLIRRKLPATLTTPDPITLVRHLVEAHEAGASHAVLEVSSHSLDQRRTAGIVFSAAVLTNLTQDHMDYHATAEAYLRAKRRLFDDLPRDAVAVVNADDPASGRILERCQAPTLRYGLREPAEVRGRVLSETKAGGQLLIEHGGRATEVRTALVGRHNLSNALAAAAAAIAIGLELDAVRAGLADLRHVPGRLQPVETHALGFDVFVDYAHTDDALRNVLRALRPLTPGKLWCVFGCGGDRDRSKRPLMAQAVAEGADAFVVTSDNPRTEDPLAIIAEIERGLTASQRRRGETVPDRREAIRRAVEHLAPGDTLLIAGKGHETYQILGETRIHFDDLETASEAVGQR
ncbi:MAG: UDP-N-acetylmuramoyl-L-alanyl-D-glutamate--2,6-diaminopimelate ligase [Phycisphaerae bacterium]